MHASGKFILTAFALAASTATPSFAAMQLCQSITLAATREAATEVEGKRLALQDWTKQAELAYGATHTRWQLAWGRTLGCTRQASGTFRCTAEARPCRLSQTAPAEPITPLRR